MSLRTGSQAIPRLLRKNEAGPTDGLNRKAHRMPAITGAIA
jgi:hypothetical protein